MWIRASCGMFTLGECADVHHISMEFNSLALEGLMVDDYFLESGLASTLA